MIATNERFENFVEDDDERLSDIELKVLDLEKGISEWRESRARELDEPAASHAGASRSSDGTRGTSRDGDGMRGTSRGGDGTRGQRRREFLRATGNPQRERGPGRAPAGRRRPEARHAWPIGEDEPLQHADRTRVLIDQGRRTARRPRSRRGRKIAAGSAAGLAVLIIGTMIVLRKGPSWPPSVATVQSEITIACQNPNVASEPGQVNFACGKDTSQVLWVFALMTSNDNPGYSDAKTGRKGLEPIAPAQGGEIAWSLNLHHPYDPVNPIDSLEVAARAINNIVGGATLTSANGNPTVQPGLESKPENCARYTGSSALIARAGFPSLCASPVAGREGQAALVADVYQQWMVGAGSVAAQDVSVLFANAGNPGDPQVQAILKTLPNSGR